MAGIRHFQAQDAAAFRTLNLAWIEAYFGVEPEDVAQLNAPQTTIIDKGGRILVAEVDAQIVGTIGLVPGHGAGMVELIKMATRDDMQGNGIGGALMGAAIEEARGMGMRAIWLETNTSLGPAMSLYRKAGFRQIAGDELTVSPYDRCNCQMILEL